MSPPVAVGTLLPWLDVQRHRRAPSHPPRITMSIGPGFPLLSQSACSAATNLALNCLDPCATCHFGLAFQPAEVSNSMRSARGGNMTLLPVIVGIVIFVIVLAGAFTGWAMRQYLPEHNLTDETKSVVSVSMAMVATISALVLGLLISNANSSFSVLGGEVTTLSAQILRLDRILRRYGRTQIQPGKRCGSMRARRRPISFPTIRGRSTSTIRLPTNCSRSLRTRC